MRITTTVKENQLKTSLIKKKTGPWSFNLSEKNTNIKQQKKDCIRRAGLLNQKISLYGESGPGVCQSPTPGWHPTAMNYKPTGDSWKIFANS